jgi:hypothetical protein
MRSTRQAAEVSEYPDMQGGAGVTSAEDYGARLSSRSDVVGGVDRLWYIGENRVPIRRRCADDEILEEPTDD